METSNKTEWKAHSVLLLVLPHDETMCSVKKKIVSITIDTLKAGEYGNSNSHI